MNYFFEFYIFFKLYVCDDFYMFYIKKEDICIYVCKISCFVFGFLVMYVVRFIVLDFLFEVY